jgi:hypothetical protein
MKNDPIERVERFPFGTGNAGVIARRIGSIALDATGFDGTSAWDLEGVLRELAKKRGHLAVIRLIEHHINPYELEWRWDDIKGDNLCRALGDVPGIEFASMIKRADYLLGQARKVE